jgi:hypothetical protein
VDIEIRAIISAGPVITAGDGKVYVSQQSFLRSAKRPLIRRLRQKLGRVELRCPHPGPLSNLSSGRFGVKIYFSENFDTYLFHAYLYI